MNQINTCELAVSFSSEDFWKVCEISFNYTDRVSLIIRDNMEISENCTEFLKEIDKYLIEKRTTDDWPGTKLLSGTATQYIYKLSVDFIKNLRSKVSNFTELILPDFPEDLTFLRDNNSPLFISISHEKDCWFEMTKKEREKFEKYWPGKLTL